MGRVSQRMTSRLMASAKAVNMNGAVIATGWQTPSRAESLRNAARRQLVFPPASS